MRRYSTALSVRRFLSAAAAPPLLSLSPAAWHPARHNSSKFCGRKPSGTKKSPETAPDDSVVAGAAAAGMAEAPKRRAGKLARKARAASDESKETKAQRKGRGAAVDEEEEVENGIIAERASITKLFMVSDSVASIFCTLPQDQRSIDNYLKEVDQAVIPHRAAAEWGDYADTNDVGDQKNNSTSKNKNNKNNWNSGVSHSNSACSGNRLSTACDAVARQNASAAKREIAKRVLSEERADYSLCIHVRDMEQLVPPPHVFEGNGGSSPLGTSPRGAARSPTRRAGANGSLPSLSAAPRRGRKAAALSGTAWLSPVDRIAALRKWQAWALARARASQERHRVPDGYHAITRVRFHDPHKADLTVVQGCGGSKSVGDVLEAMNRNGRGAQNNNSSSGSDDDFSAVDVEHMKDGSHSGTTRPVTPASLTTPFAVKPLLSVVASCIPRREPALGARCGEEPMFRPAAPPTAAPRRTRSVQPQREKEKENEEGAAGRKVPPMPRYTTRVTVLVEHDADESVDLLSMAERGTARKESGDGDAAVGRRQRRRSTHVYCLIADGGEF